MPDTAVLLLIVLGLRWQKADCGTSVAHEVSICSLQTFPHGSVKYMSPAMIDPSTSVHGFILLVLTVWSKEGTLTELL